MDKALKSNMKELIKSKRGFEFEEFINHMHLIQYGSEGYQPTRERRDDGAEGLIINSRTIIAAYGPDSYKEKAFLKKVNDDFEDYLNKWAKANPNWNMYFNSSLAPEQIKVSDKLREIAKKKSIAIDKIIIKGIDQILQLIENELNNKQQRELVSLLNVPKELMIFDHIRTIIDDLIRGFGIDEENIKYKIEVDVLEKIKLNYSESDAKNAEDEYTDLIENGTLKKIWNILATFESEQINTLKQRIKREFNNINGDFKGKINSLTEKYLDKYTSGLDDDFELYTRALLIYCFEQCMIGDKTNNEKKRK
ncbi:MAG TPA: hypothetical protein VFC67_11025 [Prolixibacteraceae bacterium]|nr:hypothetical protein [Prolixibacteraceae bacterium]